MLFNRMMLVWHSSLACQQVAWHAGMPPCRHAGGAGRRGGQEEGVGGGSPSHCSRLRLSAENAECACTASSSIKIWLVSDLFCQQSASD